MFENNISGMKKKKADHEIKDLCLSNLKTMKKVTVHTHFVQETGADLLIQTQSGEASNTDRGILGIFKIFFF